MAVPVARREGKLNLGLVLPSLSKKFVEEGNGNGPRRGGAAPEHGLPRVPR